MDRLKYEVVTLKNGKDYFVLEELFYDYEVYYLALNLVDENDIKIFYQEKIDEKVIFNEVDDNELLKAITPLFEEKIKNKIMSLN